MMKKPARPARRAKQPTSAKPAPPPSPQADDARRPDSRFPIVGLGASAGGLEALEVFLKNVPGRSGMAFVIVQHLDPTHPCILAELLQRATVMKVIQINDRTQVRPDCVYVIPPNKDLSILRGFLHLFDPATPRGLRLPIDFFFRSLAEDLEERSIGVILSGMGTDGTLGLRAIKAKAGMVLVQDPASAKFYGMPRSAIDAGLADVVAPVEALPGRIIAYLQHVPLLAKLGLACEDQDQSAFGKIVTLLRAQSGHDFSLYKNSTVYRRVERRMGIHQIDRITHYVRYLQENPQETELLFKELLIGVTSFFRDPVGWEALRTRVIPALLKDRPPNQTLRVWVPACSTGEEAYSLAIVFKEALEQFQPARSHALQIFATDLDKDAIEKARTAVFPANIAADVSPERLDRFFVQLDCGYQVARPIREMVIFARQNLIMDPPFTKLDLVSCRNLLIYLTPELQSKLLPLFHYSLNPGGVFCLGSAETIGKFTALFAPLEDKARIYRRRESGTRPEPVEFPLLAPSTREGTPPRKGVERPANLQSQAEQLLLQRYSPAAVLVNDQGDIVFISGRTGYYLELAAGKTNLNIFAMAREGLRYDLGAAFRKALRQKEAVIRRNVKVGANGVVQTVNLTVQTLAEPVPLRGLVMIVFTEVAARPETKALPKGSRASSVRLASLERDHEQTRQELQTTREEMRTSQEAAQSYNEEMQSTNEELTTSTEEMQSMNEELQTLNHELLSKVDSLSRLNNDMKNLFESTEVATVFLDYALHVRLFTAGASRVFKLIPGDVGRPITDIASELAYPELANHVREVLQTLVVHEQPVAARDGRWFQVRIMPYRTLDNIIDGVVITFADISISKQLEGKLLAAQAGMEKHIAEQDAQIDQAGVKLPAKIQRKGRKGAGRL